MSLVTSFDQVGRNWQGFLATVNLKFYFVKEKISYLIDQAVGYTKLEPEWYNQHVNYSWNRGATGAK